MPAFKCYERYITNLEVTCAACCGPDMHALYIFFIFEHTEILFLLYSMFLGIPHLYSYSCSHVVCMGKRVFCKAPR